jgi:hypothetical protein
MLPTFSKTTAQSPHGGGMGDAANFSPPTDADREGEGSVVVVVQGGQST